MSTPRSSRLPLGAIQVCTIFCALVVFGCAPTAQAQVAAAPTDSAEVAAAPTDSAEVATVELPDAPQPGASVAAVSAESQSQSESAKDKAKAQKKYEEGQQSSRILFIIPNFRAVSVDEKLPVLSKKEKITLALNDSFDYSSFIYVGLVAGAQDANRSTPEFHHGAAAYGRYYWHAFADNTDGNLMTEAIYPILTHEDPRYYTLGRGGFGKRLGYSLGRLFITKTDKGNKTFNISEIAGNATSASIANAYYPAQERTASKTIENWAMQVALDGASNVLKEFWPDIAHKLFHQEPAPEPAAAK